MYEHCSHSHRIYIYKTKSSLQHVFRLTHSIFIFTYIVLLRVISDPRIIEFITKPRSALLFMRIKSFTREPLFDDYSYTIRLLKKVATKTSAANKERHSFFFFYVKLLKMQIVDYNVENGQVS